MKFSTRTLPAAAAITAALIFGAQVQAQTGTTTAPGSTNPKDAPSPAPSAGSSKQMEPGMGNAPMGQGKGNAPMGQGMDQAPMGKGMDNAPMGKGMDHAPMGKGNAPMGQGMGKTPPNSMNSKDGAAMAPSGAEQPVRQSDKVAKDKAERMEKGNKPKSSMNKSNAPVRESDFKDAPAK